MELFLLLVPAIFIPVGLSIAGIWWLLSDSNDEEYESDEDSAEADDFDGL
ncbi:MAG: hypothetical protein KTR18_01365 [Acidiferrobacterales bacterium]|nr:hypothetical protein [Acidiferrobacterales bacterium]